MQPTTAVQSYHILEQCGQGSYGKVMMGYVKRDDMAEVERDIMNLLNSSEFIGFPRIYNMKCLSQEYQTIPQEQLLVTDLLGSSLSWYSKQKHFTLSQVYNIGIQLLQRIRDFHTIGYVHGDIKPCNILVGKALPAEPQIKTKAHFVGKTLKRSSEVKTSQNQMPSLLKQSNIFQATFKLDQTQTLYLIDYGISTPYVDSDGSHTAQKVLRNIRCSPQYAGLNQINGMSNIYILNYLALCRKDDIEGIFYTLVSLLRVRSSKISNYSKKPMSDNDLLKALGGIKDEKQLQGQKELLIIKETKRNLSEQLISSYLPDGFVEFYQHMIQLQFESEPDYDLLLDILIQAKLKLSLTSSQLQDNIVDEESVTRVSCILKENNVPKLLKKDSRQKKQNALSPFIKIRLNYNHPKLEHLKKLPQIKTKTNNNEMDETQIPDENKPEMLSPYQTLRGKIGYNINQNLCKNQEQLSSEQAQYYKLANKNTQSKPMTSDIKYSQRYKFIS
ncbi:ck1 family protein kinase [Stylonychia lemnae]|uniref:Casein kinase I n=1 Tax=Stylonychia lemnae TaxID=5949 RepID=A0A078A1Q6_STYLE|nr:ck1 family protein kinase [Stylonychia lemnae]|eukprot:CDW75772.1 ck1 family protein kinase [Stylonychia lemnae]